MAVFQDCTGLNISKLRLYQTTDFHNLLLYCNSLKFRLVRQTTLCLSGDTLRTVFPSRFRLFTRPSGRAVGEFALTPDNCMCQCRSRLHAYVNQLKIWCLNSLICKVPQRSISPTSKIWISQRVPSHPLLQSQPFQTHRLTEETKTSENRLDRVIIVIIVISVIL